MEDWFSYSNHCYYISTEKKNWTESKMACASNKSSLLIIENDEEMALLMSISSFSWIGLTRKSTSHDWFWLNGTLFKNNLSHFQNPNRNCGVIHSEGSEAEDCKDSYMYICKHNI
ncbi:NKG2-A/NKG2-B type II integral membrane protein-like [Echinops telfairi]|uniref:NKG2-A/NKG2-B type II integral membrane protein-like n=1 Tax=Echinops telfairi TaxID=9371 RepID=A0AC55DBS9_ECHTE|nr:NKG2-A/NKG2-B type II integral membrane protein-like [Echinops telfairi]